ncbi:hypothetical protein [Streptococcus sobrinus]|nr:hypothetical protein [Streptococcus sobrinus]
MELQIKQEITADDLMKDVKWFGETILLQKKLLSFLGNTQSKKRVSRL